MKIPKVVHILGRRFKIKQASMEEIEKVTGEPSVGAMNYTDKEIYICESMTEDDKIITLFHEVSHIGQTVVGLNQVTDPQLCEIWCETMANAYIDLHLSLYKKYNKK